MATYPTRPVMDRIATTSLTPGGPPAAGFNTGIVPVARAQPTVNDGGEAARLAAARVNQMPPAAMSRDQIVPLNPNGPKVSNWDARLARWQDRLQQLPEQAQPRFDAAINRRVARHDQQMTRRADRAARIAEIMANRGNVGANAGLLGSANGAGAGFVPPAQFDPLRRG